MSVENSEEMLSSVKIAISLPSKSSLRKSGLGVSGTEQSDPE